MYKHLKLGLSNTLSDKRFIVMAGHFSRFKFLPKAHRFFLEGAKQRIPNFPYIASRLSSTASNVNISSERANKIVYSRHEDCELHNLTVVQRFFEQASKWPNHVALVSTFLILP